MDQLEFCLAAMMSVILHLLLLFPFAFSHLFVSEPPGVRYPGVRYPRVRNPPTAVTGKNAALMGWWRAKADFYLTKSHS